MLRVKCAKRAAFVGLVASAVLAGAYPLGRAASSPLPVATAPSLGTAQSFGVLGASAVTNTGATVISGDLGISPNNASAITGFPPGIVTGATHAADGVALQAQNDVTTAYNNLAGQALDVDLSGTNLGGLTLTPGVYRFSSSAQLTGQLTLNALGNASAVWVFQIGSTFTTASGSSVLTTNGGQNCNVYWQVGSSATVGTTTAFVGNILALTSITLNTGASLSGRALARSGAVTLDTNTVSASTCTTPPPTATPVPGAPTATPVQGAPTATPVPGASTATPVPGAPTATPGQGTATPVPGPWTPTATPASAPYGAVRAGKFAGSDCTTDLRPEDGVRFRIGSQEFLTGRVEPGIDSQILAAGINQIEMQGRAGWRTCARVIDPFKGEILRQEFGDGETVLVNVPVYGGKTTEVWVTNLRVVALSSPTPITVSAATTPAPALPSPTTPPIDATETPVPAAPAAVIGELALTPTVVIPTALPRTGAPNTFLAWLALAGAGTAAVGFSMRRRRR